MTLGESGSILEELGSKLARSGSKPAAPGCLLALVAIHQQGFPNIDLELRTKIIKNLQIGTYR